jgi:hypothetical protein
MADRSERRLTAGFDPRRRIYRDPFNEYFVFLLSATSAAVVVPVLLLVVNAIAGRFAIGAFLAACVVLELFLIFGLGRPAMRPLERVGWALLWSAAALFFGFCFYHLVVSPVM